MTTRRTTTEQLADLLTAVLESSPLPYGDKVGALSVARKALQPPSDQLDDWRRQRAARGPVGSGKKTDAMREGLKTKSKGNK